MVFPLNNLPTQSKYWGREVEKKITNLESSLQSSDINNTTRDAQLSVTAGQALIAAEAAELAAQEANNAITGLQSLGTDGSVYGIHGGNIVANTITANEISSGYIYAGQIDADQINAGTVTGLSITGGTLSTSGTRRVEISGTNANFYDSSGTLTGRVTAGEDGRAATLYAGTNVTGVFMYNGGMELEANGQVQVTGGAGFHSAGPISTDSNLTVSGSFNPSSISTGSVSCSAIINSGGYAGNGFPTIGANTVSGTTFPANTFVSTSGNMARKTDASERRLKDNIQNFEFDTEAFINVNPVTFNYKREAVSDDAQAEALNVGFILDDFEDAGVSQFLVYQAEGDDFKQLRYDLMAIYLHKVVQEQNKTIKDLTARIEALETN